MNPTRDVYKEWGLKQKTDVNYNLMCFKCRVTIANTEYFGQGFLQSLKCKCFVLKLFKSYKPT